MGLKILDRLTDQLTAQGHTDPHGMAIALLEKNGLLDAQGNLTPKGIARNLMTPGERAIDRASKRSGRSPSLYVYDPQTNRAALLSHHVTKKRK